MSFTEPHEDVNSLALTGTLDINMFSCETIVREESYSS